MKDDEYKRHHDGIGMKVPLRPCETAVYTCPECENTIAMELNNPIGAIESVRCANCDVYMEFQ